MAGKIIVIGTSAGGLVPLQALVASLPADIAAPICLVQHIGRRRSNLPEILSKTGLLPAMHAEDGMPLDSGRIYIAPPDRHLLVSGDHLHLSRGPRENFARPAVDPLFRLAAESYGPDAIGVILTGRLSDGAAGIYEIKRRSGIAVVQEPQEAEFAEMPCSALAHIDVDYCVPVDEMPSLLTRLAAKPRITKPTQEVVHMAEVTTMRPLVLACPECGGATTRHEFGTLVQYRCHIGHVLTAENMAAAQFEVMEKSFEVALSNLNERIEVCQQMAERPGAPGCKRRQEEWHAAMHQAQERFNEMKNFLNQGWLLPEG